MQQLGKHDKRCSSSALETVPEGQVLQAADPVSRNAVWEEEVLKRERRRRSRRLERCAASDAIKRCREQNVAAMEAALLEAGRIEQELRRQKAELESCSSSSSNGSSGGAGGQVPALAGIRCSSDRYRRSTARAKLRSLRKLEAPVPPDARVPMLLIIGLMLALLLVSVMALDAYGVLAVTGAGPARMRPRGPRPGRGPSRGPRGSGRRDGDAWVKLGGLVVVLLMGAVVVAQQHLLVAAPARSTLGAAGRSVETARKGRQLWWGRLLPPAKMLVGVAWAAAVAAVALAAAVATEAAPKLAQQFRQLRGWWR